MSNIALGLYKYVDGVNDTPFPSSANQAFLVDWQYGARRMGGAPSITGGTINHTICLDNDWSMDVYVEYKGEKFFPSHKPTSSYSAQSITYEHKVDFYSERLVLDNVYFYDVVSSGDSGGKPVSNSTKFTFFGNITEFIARLNASMQRANTGYSVVLDPNQANADLEKQIKFDTKYISEALQEGFKAFGIPYYFVGKVCHYGDSQSSAIDNIVFEYGKDNSLMSIEKTNANTKIVNRITGVGSGDNIPYYYPNSCEQGVVDIANLSSSTITNLEIFDDMLFAKKVKRDAVLTYNMWSFNVDTPIFYLDGKPYTNGKGFSSDEIAQGQTLHVVVPFEVKYDGCTDLFMRFSVRPVATAISNLSLSPAISGVTPTADNGMVYVNALNKNIAKGKYQLAFDVNISTFSLILQVFQTEACTIYANGWKDNKDDNFYGDLEEIGIMMTGTASAGDNFKQIISKYIPPQSNLMPSIYRDSDGDERFYNATNNTYVNPDTGEYYEFPNPYANGKPKEFIKDYKDVKPTIAGAVNSASEPIDQIIKFAYDENDNDDLEEDGVTYKHPYFFALLHRTNGTYGFNLFDHTIDEGEMSLSFTSGRMGGCEFVIGVGEDSQKNLVQIALDGNLQPQLDEDGHPILVRDAETGDVICGREGQGKQIPQDWQNDTRRNEVWVALKKDSTTYGVIMPNATNNYRPSDDEVNEFVILHIDLPKAYILAAEQSIDNLLISYMAESNTEHWNFGIDFSRIYLKDTPNIANALDENKKIKIRYNGEIYSRYVLGYTYKTLIGEPLPSISIELAESLEGSTSALDTAINEINNMVEQQANAMIGYQQIARLARGALQTSNVEGAGSSTRPIYFDGHEAKVIDGLDVPESIRTQKNVEAMWGVSAFGIANMAISGTGGGGTVTAVSVNGNRYTPSNGLITLPDYPTAASLINDGLASRAWAYQNFAGKDYETRVQAIEALIPAQASSENQVADKAFVNSSVATATAEFQGTYDVVEDLGLTASATHTQIQAALLTAVASRQPDNNDYVFVSIPAVGSASGRYERYKFNGTSWAYEYTLNNSSFTAAQWAAITSGITETKVSGYDSHLARTDNPHSVTKAQVGLGNVENTALSTWVGTNNITTLGTITTGVWHGSAIGYDYLASAVQTSLGKADTALQSESDPVFTASAAYGITSADITAWNAKQNALAFDGTYDASTNKVATKSTVTNAINALDVSKITGFGAGKTLASLTETDGKIAATFQDISITKSQVSDFPTTWALADVTDADDLKAIEALTGTSGFMKKTAANTWALDTDVASGTALSDVSTRVGTMEGYFSNGKLNSANIDLATGDNNGQVKIAGTNVSVKGWNTAATHAHGDYVTAVGIDATNGKLKWYLGGVAQTAPNIVAARLVDTNKTMFGNTYWTASGIPASIGTATAPAALDYVTNIDGLLYFDKTNRKVEVGTSASPADIQSFGGVAALGIANMAINSGGGQGTLTQIKVNGTALSDVNGVVNIPLAVAGTNGRDGAMSNADKTKLDGIADHANNYTLPVATSGALGGIRIGYGASGKYYAVQLDNNNKAYVYVPWSNTEYTFYDLAFQNASGTQVDIYKPTTSPSKTIKAGSNVTISAASNVITIAATDTTYAFASGDNNGQIKVTPSGGTAQNIDVTGLDTAAFHAASDFATSDHTHTTSIASSTGTNQLNLNFGTKYALTAGGTNFIFTMPTASISNGVITIGSNNITPLTSHQTLYNLVINNSAGTAQITYKPAVSGTYALTLTKAMVGLGNVENTALSTWAGSTNITTLGTITTGTWNGTAIADNYIASAATWNAKQDAISDLATIRSRADEGHTAYGYFSGTGNTLPNNKLVNSSISIAGTSVSLGGSISAATLKSNLGLGASAYVGYDTAVTKDSTNLITSGAVWTAIDNLPEPMVFKGSLGTGGTITALPVNGSASIGDTYKVITAGTYASKAAKVGDTFICLTKTSSANTWELIPSGDEPSGTVTSVGLSMPTGFSVSSSPVTSSGTLTVAFASGYSLPTTEKQGHWDDAYDKRHTHSSLTLSTTAQVYDGTHTLALPASDPYTSARTPSSHASSGTGYGVGTTSNYGHVKLATGDMNGASGADGVACGKNHTHSQYALAANLGTASSHNHGDYVTAIGTSGNTLTWSKGGTAQTAITVPYATNADTVDGYHASQFGFNRFSSNYDCNEVGTHFAAYRFSGTPTNVFPNASYSNMLVIGGDSDTMTQIGAPYNVQELYFRAGTWYSDGTGSIRTATWQRIVHSGNISSFNAGSATTIKRLFQKESEAQTAVGYYKIATFTHSNWGYSSFTILTNNTYSGTRFNTIFDVRCSDDNVTLNGFSFNIIGGTDISSKLAYLETKNGDNITKIEVFMLCSRYEHPEFFLIAQHANSNILTLNTTDWGATPDKAADTTMTGSAENTIVASALTTARTIWGQSFDGSANVDGNFVADGTATLYPKGIDNTAFKGTLVIKQQNNTEPSGDNWSASNPSFGIQFNRFWTNNSGPYGETPCAGIYATVSASWRGGLVFRTKNNQTQGGTPDITALRLAPSGAAEFASTITASGTIKSTYSSGPAFAAETPSSSWAFMRFLSGTHDWHIGTVNTTSTRIGQAGAFEIRSVSDNYSGISIRRSTSAYGKLVVTVPSGECSIGYRSGDSSANPQWVVGIISSNNRFGFWNTASSNFVANFSPDGSLYLGDGDTAASYKLHVAGTMGISGQITSTVATGTAPLVVASTTAVTNLNADLLDGQHGSYYAVKAASKGSTTKPIYTDANGAFQECSTYAGGTAVTLNGTSKAASTASFYAPTGAGSNGNILQSTGGTPSWVAQSTLVAGKATILETTRTLWGQNFNGSANVTGNMSNVGNIAFSASGKNIGGLLYFDTTNRKVEVGTSSSAADLCSMGGVSAMGIASMAINSVSGVAFAQKVTMNGQNYEASNGVITLPNYTATYNPSNSGSTTEALSQKGAKTMYTAIINSLPSTSTVAGWGYKKGMVYTTATASDSSIQVATGADPTYQYVTNTSQSSLVITVTTYNAAANSYGVHRYIMIYNNRSSATTVQFFDPVNNGVIGPADSVSIPANSYMEFSIIHPASNAKCMVTWSMPLKNIETM